MSSPGFTPALSSGLFAAFSAVLSSSAAGVGTLTSSVFTASTLGCASAAFGASSAFFWSARSAAAISAGFWSGVASSTSLASTGLSSEDAASAVLSVISVVTGSASDFTVSDFGSVATMPALSAATGAETFASDIVMGAGAAPASAVWVCSLNGAGAVGSLSIADRWSSCPTVDRSASFGSGIAVSVLATLSLFADASGLGASAATGCGTTFCVTSSGCEKGSGFISPGVTITRAPIRVQPYILTAKAIGMRMQPCDAG